MKNCVSHNIATRINMKSSHCCTLVFILLFFLTSANATDSIVQQWKSGLKGTRLVSYSGSAISSSSTLTTINFCNDGRRYNYYREGSWSIPGMAGGASNNSITGQWDIQQTIIGVSLTYITDQGASGAFPIYLQANGKVNVGGVAYAVQRGGAGC